MEMAITITGLEAVQARIAALGPQAVTALQSAMVQEAEAIMTESKRLVPVDTGALRASGHVADPTAQGQTVQVQMGYGGSAAPYAVLVHEMTQNKHRTPTQAKYLETPFREAIAGMAGRIAARIARRLGV